MWIHNLFSVKIQLGGQRPHTQERRGKPQEAADDPSTGH